MRRAGERGWASGRRTLIAAFTVVSSLVFSSSSVAESPSASGPTGDDGGAGVLSAATGDDDYAVSFTRGSTSLVSTSASTGNALSDGFTVEAWVKPDGCASGDYNVVSREIQYVLSCRNGYWQYALGDGTNWYQLTGIDVWHSTGISVDPGEWHHIALTRSSSAGTLDFYYDGVLANSRSGVGALGAEPNSLLYIGDRVGGCCGFSGEIDDVRLWTVGRGAAIATDMHTYGPTDSAGLLAYYDFNEGPAGSAGAGTVYNRASAATSATNLRMIGGPNYVSVEEAVTSGSTTTVTFPRSYLTAAGGWRVPDSAASIDVAVVGGGGAGGWNSGGGGGGGGASQQTVSGANGTIRTITVGQGGYSFPWPDETVQATIDTRHVSDPMLSNGQSSRFGDIIVSGGARGLSRGWDSRDVRAGGAGGSGASQAGGDGGSAPGYGNDGNAGAGGFTMQAPFSGDYSGGGGGGGGWSGGVGGAAGDSAAGAGGSAGTNGASAPVNGGGGGGGGSGAADGGHGGSGVVIVRYATPAAANPSNCAPVSTTYTEASTTFRVLTFAEVGSCLWTVPGGLGSVSYVVVAGGGAGGRDRGGGGGGGGVLSSDSATVTAGEVMLISVGAGGVASASGGTNGENSSFGSVAVAIGGGAGGSHLACSGCAAENGSAGGSGGGASMNYWTFSPSGGSATSGQGTVGADAFKPVDNPRDTGGGGGAGGASVSGDFDTPLAPDGGAGMSSSITGSTRFFGGGGGGGTGSAGGYNTAGPGSGGSGVGGSGGSGVSVGGAGVASTGGGGGGGGEGAIGGAGGSGVVIIRYALSSAISCSPASYTYTDTSTEPDTSFTVLEFTEPGTCGWTPPAGLTEVDALLVAGGGAGGGGIGGGGGAGEVVPLTNKSISGSQTITVGAGGVGIAGVGGDGGDTTALGVTVAGGGGGGWLKTAAGEGAIGRNGGSGGGGACNQTTGGTAVYLGGDATSSVSGSGNDGGDGYNGSASACIAGGGGGAGEIGQAGTSTAAGSGGAGIPSSITGATVFYGGGGGGGINGYSGTGTPSAGGVGGGGAGGTLATPRDGFDGTDGLGGGGGGGSNTDDGTTSVTGGDGGDGVVIVRYENNPGTPTSVTGEATAPNEVTASWTAPTYTGSSAIVGYSVVVSINGGAYAAPSAGTCTTASSSTSTSCTVTGVAAGSTVTFKVTASNSTLSGNQSTASSAVTAYGPLASFTIQASGGGAIGSQVAGTPFAVKVTAVDAGGRTVTNFTGTVDMSSSNTTISSGSGTTVAFTAGVLASHSVTVTTAGLNKTLTATRTSGGSESVTSSGFTVTPGAASALSIATQPVGGAPGGRLATQPVIAVHDAYGNTVTGDNTTSVTATIASGANGTLSGTTSVTASSGVTTFTTLAMNGDQGADYTLQFAATGLTSATSASLDVDLFEDSTTDGGGWKLVAYGDSAVLGGYLNAASGVYDPATRTGKSTFDARSFVNGASEVAISWNQTGFSTGGIDSYQHAVKWSLPSPSSMTLTGVSGTCTSNCTSDFVPVTITDIKGTSGLSSTQYMQATTFGANYGSSYGLVSSPVNWGPDSQSFQALYLGNPGGTSTHPKSYFTTNGTTTGYVPSTAAIWVRSLTADRLAVRTSAAGAASGSAFTTQPAVEIRSSSGAVVTTDNSSVVTAAVSTGGSLVGTTTATAVNGVATFSTLGVAGTAGTYTLTFSSGDLTIATQTVTVTAGTASSLSITTAAGDTTYGTDFSPQPAITILDASGNTVTSPAVTVTATVKNSDGDTLETATATSSSGVATFTGLGSDADAGTVTVEYTASGLTTTSESVVVSPATLTVTASSPSVTYGDAVPSVSPSYSGFVNGESSSVVTTAPTCSTTYTALSSVLSSPSTSCSGGAATNYTLSHVDGSVSIGQATLTVTASSPSVTYGDALPSVSPSYSGFVNGESSSVVTTAPTCSTTYTATSSVGSAPSTSCSGAVATNYTFTYSNGSVTIAKATPTFTWADASATFGDDPVTITAPSPSTPGTFTYASSDTSVATISGSTMTVVGAGSSTLTATFTPTDTTNFVANGTVTQVVTVAKGSQQALTVTSTSGTYLSAVTLAVTGGSTGGAVSYSVVDGTATGCAVSGGELTTSSAGTCTVTATRAGDDDYQPVSSAPTTVTFAKAPQTITFANPAPSGATYGDAAIPISPSSDSGLAVTVRSSDDAICSVSGGGVNIIRAGTCTLTASQDGDSNYLAATDVGRTFTIAKANQATLLMTSPSTAVFGETITLASSGGSGTGSISYGIVSGTCTITGGTTLTLGDAGSDCQVAASKQTDANHNTVTSTTQTITITKAGQTLAFTSAVPTSPVSGDTYTPTASAISTITGLASGVQPTFAASGTCGIAGGVVTFVASGDCVITASAVADTNFTAASDVTQTIAVGSINQNITFPQPSAVAYGSSSVAMDASASSSLTVTYTRGAGTTNSACSVSALGVVTVLAVGMCEVVASQSGDDQYAPASSVTRAFQVEPALPTAPTLTSGSASSQSITVAFTAPGFTGGVSIAAYEISATPTGGGMAIVDTSCVSSPCTISGLANGTEYTVTVAAINEVGTGSASTPTGPLTPVTAAFAVGAFSAVPGDAVVDLSWEPLTTAQLGGGSFTRYEISYREAGMSPTPAWTLATDALVDEATANYQVTGLDNGSSYDFQLVAFTSANAFEIAGNTALVVQYPSTMPSEPRNLAVLVSTPTDVEFSWEVPLADGGSTIDGYSVTVTSESDGASSPITCTVAGVATSCTASNLTNGAVYEFTVEATNRMSTGSNGVVASTTYSVPSSDSSLAALVVNGGGSTLTLTPAFDSEVVDYTVAVVNEIDEVTVTPTASKDASTITVNGVAVATGSVSSALSLDVGANEILISVTASDPRYSTGYSVTVTRAEPIPVVEEPADDEPVDEPATTDTVPARTVGDDDTPTVPVTQIPAASKGLALYVDADGVTRPASFTVLETTSPRPILVAGDAGDLVMTARGVDTDSTFYDEESENLGVFRGESLVVSGDGFQPGTGIEVWLFSTPTLLGTTTAGADGTWTLEVRIGPDVAVGEHSLQAEGTATAGTDRSIRATLVIADPTPVVMLPESGTDLDMMNYAILIAALGAMLALLATGTRRRFV